MQAEYRLSLSRDEDFDGVPVFTRSIASSNRLEEFEENVSPEPCAVHKGVSPGGLSYLESSLFATTLEDVITQLHLLDECNLEMRIFKLKTDMVELLAAKFSVKPATFTDELDMIDMNKIYSEQYKLNKIISDRRICNSVMKDTYLDLSLENKFDPIVTYRQTVTNRNRYVLQLAEDGARNKMIKRDLLKNLRHNRNRQKSAIYDTDLVVTNLISRIEDFALQTAVRGRYVDNWQQARTEQNSCRISTKEAGPSKEISYFRKRCEDETRVHNEIELLINLQYNETMSRVEDIMAKYDTDIEALDLKIERMRKQYEEQIDTKDEMEERLAEHDKEMKAWVKFKTDRENARLYRVKMNKAAISVQAWWRGILVRLQLGPYKPQKKPPAAAKKKK